ncbi:hypothetical protein GmarT_36280 [Gimesia maris]|uniref:Uncharacterized protein n=1 Tax=Gimesia maris TaxID=122 RepID=A0ABX5YPT7_9PLAN|nr:hypothetical protein GmarT_36280 [Gimesia maris]
MIDFVEHNLFEKCLERSIDARNTLADSLLSIITSGFGESQ